MPLESSSSRKRRSGALNRQYGRVDEQTDPSRTIRLTKAQWAETFLALVVIWTQVVLLLALDQRMAAAILGLAFIALAVHIYTWLFPLLRRARSQRRS